MELASHYLDKDSNSAAAAVSSQSDSVPKEEAAKGKNAKY